MFNFSDEFNVNSVHSEYNMELGRLIHTGPWENLIDKLIRRSILIGFFS